MSVMTKVREYGYDSTKPAHTHAYLWPVVLDALGTRSGRLLDAGCGNGAFAAVLSQRGFNVCGVDLSESGIAQARIACPEGDFAVMSVTDNLRAIFPEPFDVVVSLEVVEHVFEPDLFAASLFSALKPGGVLVVTTPYHGYFKNLLLALTGRMDSHFTALWPYGHIKFWSRRTLTRLLDTAGFRVETFRGAGRCPGLWKSMVLVARRES